MEKRGDILYRLARFLAGVPPETLGAMALVTLERPELVAAVVLWMLYAILGQIFVTLAFAFLRAYMWSTLPPRTRRAIRRAMAACLPSGVLRHLDVLPGDEPNAEVGTDQEEEARVPKAWVGKPVTVELRVLNGDSGDFGRITGDLLDTNDLGATIKVPSEGRLRRDERPSEAHTFYPWTSIKGMTHRPDRLDETKDEEIGRSTE